MTIVDEQGNPIGDNRPQVPQGQLPPAPPEQFRGLVHSLESLYVKALTPRPRKEAIDAGYGFLALGISFLQDIPEEEKFCERRLQFIRETTFPKLRRTLGVSADRIPVMILESEGTKSRHLVPPLNSRPYEEAIMEEILFQFYNTQLLPEVQVMAIHLEKRGILRRESRVAHQLKSVFKKKELDDVDEDADTPEEETS